MLSHFSYEETEATVAGGQDLTSRPGSSLCCQPLLCVDCFLHQPELEERGGRAEEGEVAQRGSEVRLELSASPREHCVEDCEALLVAVVCDHVIMVAHLRD